jgi:hypothetical protein
VFVGYPPSSSAPHNFGIKAHLGTDNMWRVTLKEIEEVELSFRNDISDAMCDSAVVWHVVRGEGVEKRRSVRCRPGEKKCKKNASR